jgi:diguanylate cyclase (GGDEF)-like protein
VRRAIRKHRSVGIILVDIDNFKQYNTRFFLDGGDAMLIALGRFLKEHIRSEDVACRYGGDEFLLVLPDASRAISRGRAKLICEYARQLHPQYEGRTIGPVALSFGVAIYPQNGSTSQLIMKSADEALYRAKRTGRGQLHMAQ